MEQLRASVDFLVELCHSVSPVRRNLVTVSYELTYVTLILLTLIKGVDAK